MKVVDGDKALDQLLAIKRNAAQPSVMLKVAEAIGDTRSTVAKKALGKPLERVIITNCGILWFYHIRVEGKEEKKEKAL